MTEAFVLSVQAENLILNSGFEEGEGPWVLYIPKESVGKEVQFSISNESPHSGIACAKLESKDFVRYCLSAKKGFHVQPGERYRIAAWIKAGGAEAQEGSPGVAIRLTLIQGNTDAPGGHLFLDSEGNIAPFPTLKKQAALSKEWKNIEGVFEIPEGTDQLRVDIFSWITRGAFFLDDLTLERVDTSTALTYQNVEDLKKK